MSDNRNLFLNKDTFDAITADMEDARAQAAASKDAAATSESNAGNSATAADTAKTASETARDKSQEWADKAVDSEVETGKFSSKHHATKSGESATASDTAKTASVAAKDKSQKWADENVDVEVETGKFSSKHHATKSGESAAAAATSESNAGNSASAADTAKTGAEAARDKAESWADANEDIEVETGQFSAKHHAIKADASAADAATEKAAAETAAAASAAFRDQSEAFSDISAAYANFAGVWANLTGALNVPASVHHNDTFWMLMVDLADVTTSEPSGANTDWEPIGASVTSVNGKTGAVVIEITDIDGLQSALDGKEPTITKNTAFNRNFGTGGTEVPAGNDSRFSDAREWTAIAVSQAEAEAGTETIARKWTALRIRQAIVAWWNAAALIVNDLTTGGVDKVASAETVKTLENNKADLLETEPQTFLSDLEATGLNNTPIENSEIGQTSPNKVKATEYSIENTKEKQFLTAGVDSIIIDIDAQAPSGVWHVGHVIIEYVSIGNKAPVTGAVEVWRWESLNGAHSGISNYRLGNSGGVLTLSSSSSGTTISITLSGMTTSSQGAFYVKAMSTAGITSIAKR